MISPPKLSEAGLDSRLGYAAPLKGSLVVGEVTGTFPPQSEVQVLSPSKMQGIEVDYKGGCQCVSPTTFVGCSKPKAGGRATRQATSNSKEVAKV